MLPHLRTAILKAFLLTTFILSVQSQDKPTFPKLKELGAILYQTEVQLTDVEHQAVAYATEYHDADISTSTRGRVDILDLGQKLSLFYFSDQDELIQIDSKNGCKGGNVGDSIYDYQPVFYGWLNKDPLIIGPSAPLWMAQKYYNDIVLQKGEFEIRNIMCDKFSLNINNNQDNIIYNFYFAVKNWTTPYQLENLRVPIRIEVIGNSSVDEAKGAFYTINQYTDFSYFRPDVKDWKVFQIPEGVGCFYRNASDKMPKMPKVYQYSAEVVDLLKAEDNEMSDIEFQRVWYDGVERLARLDKYTKKRYTSELYDFNTGVTYSMVDGRTCDIKALRNSYFEGYDGQMMGHLKEPGEVLGLDNKFYYVGKKLIRGIWSDVFETVVTDVTFMKKELKKLVITIYYSQEYYEVNIEDGDTETRVPVYYAVKGWDDKNKVVLNLQYNIFGFDNAAAPRIYTTFRLGRCFPSINDKSYFVMSFEVSTQLAAKMEGQDDYIMDQLRALISKNAKVSDLRIPLLRADYTSYGVYVMGLMLDRPPALKQFWLEYESKHANTNDPYLKVAPAADTLEKCAFACVDEGDFTCTGFFFCNQACFIKSKDILERGNDKDNFNFGDDSCQEWLRADMETTNKEAYLADALRDLEKAVVEGPIKVIVKIDEDKRADTFATVTNILIGDGPYIGKDKQDTPYDLKIEFAKLDPTDESTQQLSYIDTLNDCYTACKRSGDIDCSSFSYCPDASNKQCSLSSVLVLDRKTNIDDVVSDKNCYVYSMKYLDFYQEYPGRTALIPGADVLKDIKSPEECAKSCRQAKKISCRGFEYCYKTMNCILHSKHVLDLKPGEVVNTDKKTSCVHFAAKYTADYYDMGYVLLDDKSDVRQSLTLEDCSKICSEELKDKCLSFNYCSPTSLGATDSSCAVSPLTLTSPRITTTKKEFCRHFEKKDKVDDWGNSDKKPLVTTGYTASGFTWLVIGMLVLGGGLGALGFVVYSYYRSKSLDNMTVRFVKNDQI